MNKELENVGSRKKFFFFFKQKTEYEISECDWSSGVCSSDLEFGLGGIPLNQTCFLAQELASMIDLANNENVSFSRLKNLVPEQYSSHWQETLKFLEIITKYWPDILKERGLIDVAEKKNLLIKKQCEIWQKTKTEKRIIIAGSTATFPVLKEFFATVLSLPNGEVILSGLDCFLDDFSWEKIDETHP